MEMASEIGAELLCAICLDVFKEAVTLRCGHSFCRSCVTQSWQNSDKQACAVCRDESSTGEELITNHALNNVVERFLQQQQQFITEQGSADMCRLHGEKLKIFCFDDRQLICLVCQTSRKHEKHKLRPMQEAALEQREQQQSVIRNLKVKLAKYEKSEKQHDQMKNHLQKQYVKTERKIKAEFNKFYAFLQDEEQRIISDLKAEEEEKRERLDESVKEINEVITELTHIIHKLEQELQESDLHFIMKYSRKRSAISTCEDPSDLPTSALLDEARYVGDLGYNIWKEMENVASPNEKCKLLLYISS
ncbi:E3 ubiquitin-protein ligase TRIM35-like [Protopterus annectens]|uniref:E3 ubiquitin-protein ligase TRIM35-like n=1 Tax=Protopterus annectens TaxID=7888 RepID=UPI001CFA3040|nr:E3 ubiquitin-protein ligase TRIM35-like [Protopterus annectens]